MAGVKIAIRQATPEECVPEARLQELHQIVFGDAAPLPEFRTGFWWVAFYRRAGSKCQASVGFAGLRVATQHKNAGYLCRCGVLPNWRGAGLQRRMIFAREKFARRLGMRLLVTDTYDNPHSDNNLMLLGYKQYQPKTPWSFSGATYWRKEI